MYSKWEKNWKNFNYSHRWRLFAFFPRVELKTFAPYRQRISSICPKNKLRPVLTKKKKIDVEQKCPRIFDGIYSMKSVTPGVSFRLLLTLFRFPKKMEAFVSVCIYAGNGEHEFCNYKTKQILLVAVRSQSARVRDIFYVFTRLKARRLAFTVTALMGPFEELIHIFVSSN